MAAGRPQLLFPAHLEQLMNARRLHALGVAHYLTGQFPSADIGKGLRQLLTDPDVHRRDSRDGCRRPGAVVLTIRWRPSSLTANNGWSGRSPAPPIRSIPLTLLHPRSSCREYASVPLRFASSIRVGPFAFPSWLVPAQAQAARPRFRPNLELLEERIALSNASSFVYEVTSTADNTAAVDKAHAGTQQDPYLAPSLRSAILSADGDAGPDTIFFAPSTANGVIDLTLAPLNPTTGAFPGPTAFDVNNTLTITGSGQTITRDASAANFRFFFVEATGSLSLSNLTLSNGAAVGGDGFGGGGGAAGLGGAIYNDGSLNLMGVTLTTNRADGGAGGAGGGGGGGGGLGGTATGPNGGGPNAGLAGGAYGGGGGGFGGGGSGFGGGSSGGGSGALFGSGGSGGFGGGGGGAYGGGGGGFGGGGGGGGSGGGGGGFGGGSGGFGGGGGFGDTSSLGGGGGGGGFGGGIFSQAGSVTIANSTLFGNSVAGGAGGAGGANTFSTGEDGNGGSGFGGAVFAAGGTLTITDSTLSGNSVMGGAGAVVGSAEGSDVYLADNGGRRLRLHQQLHSGSDG